MEWAEISCKFRTAIRNSGSDEFDVDRFFADGMYEMMFSTMYPYFAFEDEMDPDAVKFWAEYDKGLKKQMMYGDERKCKYVLYTPLSMANSSGRKYPLIFVMHGGANTTSDADNFGFVQLAAREEIIIVAPEFEETAHVMDILREVKTLCPVDESQIYCTGFSFGGGMASRMAVKHQGISGQLDHLLHDAQRPQSRRGSFICKEHFQCHASAALFSR